MNFINKHKKLVIFLSIAIVLLIIMLIIRNINLNKRKQMLESESQSTLEVVTEEESGDTTQVTTETTSFDSNLDKRDNKKTSYVTLPSETKPTNQETTSKFERFDLTTLVYDRTAVPDVLIDGSSCINYFNNVKLSSFDTNWGTALTDADYSSKERILVGQQQNKNKSDKGDLQSIGWLMNNLNNISDNTCIKFTDLHVIGSLSDDHVALLCMYNWFSVFGLKDTLVVFEDLSGTLNLGDFAEGSVFSSSVYRHNIKLMNNVNGQRVLVVQYMK